MVIALFVLLFIVLLFFVLAIVRTLVGIIVFLVVAALCGAAAEYFLGAKEGVGETLVIGLIGAALGTILSHLLRLPSLIVIGGLPLVWTIVGSMIVIAILKAVRRQPGRLGSLS